MTKTSQSFIWSARAAEAFEVCRRKRYWSAYGDAQEWRRLLTRSELTQRVVRSAAHWALSKWQAGETPTAAVAYEEIARPQLNNAWTASRSREWCQPGTDRFGVQELHFPECHADLPVDWPQRVKQDVMEMLEYFVATVCPRWADVEPDPTVQGPQTIAWPEEHAKIRVEPDFVCEVDNVLQIHVWAADPPSPEHLRHVAVLVWWAEYALGRAPETVHVWMEFLRTRQRVREVGSPELVDQARAMMLESMMDMSDYLEQADRPRNRPLPKAEWDMTPDRDVCRQCRYYALCEPEFGE